MHFDQPSAAFGPSRTNKCKLLSSNDKPPTPKTDSGLRTPCLSSVLLFHDRNLTTIDRPRRRRAERAEFLHQEHRVLADVIVDRERRPKPDVVDRFNAFDAVFPPEFPVATQGTPPFDQDPAEVMGVAQFSTVRPGIAARSESSLTTVQLPRERATAATMMSICCIGRPIRLSSAASFP
jgi:hypothetical protein